jgi:hypothetical protein
MLTGGAVIDDQQGGGWRVQADMLPAPETFS